MLPEDFNALELHDKSEIVFQQGTFIKALDTYSKKNKALYGYNDLLIEVTFDKETNKIEDIQAWANKPIQGVKK